MPRNEAIEHLHGAFLIIAPNSVSQTALTDLRNDMEKNGISDKQIMLAITEAIYDGLAYGNWIGLKIGESHA